MGDKMDKRSNGARDHLEDPHFVIADNGRVKWNFVSSPRGDHAKRLAFGRKATAAALAAAFSAILTGPSKGQSVPTPSTLVSVCSGVSLPPSAVTGIMDPVLTGIYGPIESDFNQTLGALGPLLGLPAPLNVDVTGLLTTAASGSDIGLSVLSINGTIVGPSDQCDAAADSYTLDNPAGVSIGGNQITGLGSNGDQASAGEIDSIAIGNNAATDATATASIAIGTDATVGANALGSIALGSNSSATGINSVAIGAGSVADRDDSVSVGAPGTERQITNVAAGSATTDAVNLGQLNAVAALIPADSVQYDDSSHTIVTLDGVGGTTLTNVAPGAVTSTSTDAVNGSQLFAVQTQVDGIQIQVDGLQTQVTNNTNDIATLQTQVGTNTTDISNLQTQVGTNTTDITNLQTQVITNSSDITNLQTQVTSNTSDITNLQTDVANNTTNITNLTNDVTSGAIGPVQYSDAGSPTVPNGGTPSNDVTLVGGAAGPVGIHNVADGVIAAGSTDAVNGGQIYDLTLGVSNAVTYDNSSRTDVTLNSGGAPAVIHNVGNGVATTDAVNVGQLSNSMNNAVNIANQYTDMRLEELDFDLSEQRKDARSGTAAALAAAAMPQASGEGRTMIAGGVSTYRGKVGVALGASHRAQDGKSIYKLGLTYDSSEHFGAHAGAGFEF